MVVKGGPQGSRIEECTARIATVEGFWYVSGQGPSFQRKVLAALRRLKMPMERLIVMADGAWWIRDFYSTELAFIALSELILDWYHLQPVLAREEMPPVAPWPVGLDRQYGLSRAQGAGGGRGTTPLFVVAGRRGSSLPTPGSAPPSGLQ